MVLLAPASRGASTTGGLSGQLTDVQGSAVSGASVTLADADDAIVRRTATDEQGAFRFSSVEAGHYRLTAESHQFATISTDVSVIAGEIASVSLQFKALASQRQAVTVVASAPSVLTPDPSERIVVRDQVLDGNPGRPGAPISLPGLPIETASGGIKAPQYFAPGVAGDHGEPIAQFFRIGGYLYPNNLPANSHGNGYADPNFLIAPTIDAVEVDGGAFNVRKGNNAVNLAADYEPKRQLNPFLQLTGGYRDVDVVVGLSPANLALHSWLTLETSYGNGFLKRLEHRQQYKLNAYRELRRDRHDLTLFGIGYYGFSRIPGLIPIEARVPDDTIDYRQLDRTPYIAAGSYRHLAPL